MVYIHRALAPRIRQLYRCLSTSREIFYTATGSPNAFIAECAVSELSIRAASLFKGGSVRNNKSSERNSGSMIPRRFRESCFQFVHPKDLNYELPLNRKPEIAFLGRSNVGKSSLINSLTRMNRGSTKDKAYVSKTPGRTQQVNYYAILPSKTVGKGWGNVGNTNVRGYFIDLPGYGHANAPVKKIKGWSKVTQDFLQGRDADVMKRVFLLVDSRHGLQSLDVAVMSWFDQLDMPYTIVLTKADRARKHEMMGLVNELCMRYHTQLHGRSGGCQGPVIHISSSKDKKGINELMYSIDTEFQ